MRADRARRCLSSAHAYEPHDRRHCSTSRAHGSPAASRSTASRRISGALVAARGAGAPGGGARSAIELHDGRRPVGDWDADRLAQVASNLDRQRRSSTATRTRRCRCTLDGAATDVLVLTIGEPTPAIDPADILPLVFDPFRGGQRRRARAMGWVLACISSSRSSARITARSTWSDEGRTRFTVTIPKASTGHTDPQTEDLPPMDRVGDYRASGQDAVHRA